MKKLYKKIILIFIFIMIFTFNISRASSVEEQIQNTEQQISQLFVRLIRGKEVFDSDIYEVSDEIKQ